LPTAFTAQHTTEILRKYKKTVRNKRVTPKAIRKLFIPKTHEMFHSAKRTRTRVYGGGSKRKEVECNRLQDFTVFTGFSYAGL
jgi:hypothetical protein